MARNPSAVNVALLRILTLFNFNDFPRQVEINKKAGNIQRAPKYILAASLNCSCVFGFKIEVGGRVGEGG